MKAFSGLSNLNVAGVRSSVLEDMTIQIPIPKNEVEIKIEQNRQEYPKSVEQLYSMYKYL